MSAPLAKEIERRKNRAAEPPPKKMPTLMVQDVTTIQRQSKCIACEAEFQASVLLDNEVEICSMRFCPACLLKRSIDSVEERRESSLRFIEERFLKTWPSICPPLYQKTEVSRLPYMLSPAVIEKVLATEYSAKGVGLSGPTRLGKTRLMFLLLRKLHSQGHWVKYINAATFSDTLASLWSESASEANGWVKSMCDTPALFIDDLGKGRMTERSQSTLWRIVEHRTAWEKPIFVTANPSGAQLIDKMNQEQEGGSDAAEPIVERLREFVDFIDL